MQTPPVPQPAETRIFIACQNLIYFGFLESLLNKECIFISGTCNTPRQAVRLCDPMAIDVLVLDMALADGYVRKFLTMRPLLKIIGVTKDFEKPVIQAMRLLKMRGYIYMNPLNKERTIECIAAVMRDELFFRF